jgi:hypothetical protein
MTPLRTDAPAPTVGDIRRWIRDRRLRGGQARWSRDGMYVVLLCAVFAVAVIVTWARDLVHAEQSSSGATVPVIVASALAASAALTWAAATFGPLSAAPATLTWIATGPVSRRQLLLPRFAAVLALGGLAGTASALIGLSQRLSGTAVGVVIVIGLCAGVTVGAGATAVQATAHEPDRVLRGVAAVTGLVALAVAAAPARVVGSHRWPSWPTGHGTLWAGVAVVLAGAVSAFAVHRLDRVRLAALRSAAASTAVVADGVGIADPGLMARVAEERRWRHSHLRGRLPRMPGGAVIVAHDALALLRLPGRLPVAVALALAPVLVAALSVSDTVLAGCWVCAGLLAVGQTTTNVRYEAERPTLSRLMGRTDRQLIRLRSVVPIIVAVTWTAASVALLLGGTLAAVALGAAVGPALAAGAVRAARRSRVRHDYPLIVTPMGVAASGPLLWVAQGPDLVVIGALPTLHAVTQGGFGAATVVTQAALAVAILVGYLATAGGGRPFRTRVGRSSYPAP